MKIKLSDRSISFSILTIRLIKQLPRDYIYQIIYRQIIRSITSIGANINEAQSAPTRKDFTNYYSIALKSANESFYWLKILFEILPLYKNKLLPIEQELNQLSKILAASILTLKNKRTTK